MKALIIAMASLFYILQQFFTIEMIKKNQEKIKENFYSIDMFAILDMTENKRIAWT